MTEPLPEWVEEIIAEQEAELTAELRERTGRDDLVAEFDRTPIKWPDDFRGFGSNVRPRKQR